MDVERESLPGIELEVRGDRAVATLSRPEVTAFLDRRSRGG